jgi:hypothetical protein
MKFRRCGLLLSLCATVAAFSALPCAALDRDAFTFTQYTLTIRIEPEQQRLAAEGRVSLRNDSSLPQKTAALQISSTLSWRAIQSGGKPLQFLMQPYESDIDHTGQLSEAIVTLPKEIPPKAEIDLDIRYEGIVPLDATRLTRIGTPKDVAAHTDWDQIGPSFTAVRGIGYVTWYPVSIDAVSLSDENTVFEAIGKWKARERGCAMALSIASTSQGKLLASGSLTQPATPADAASNVALTTSISDLSQNVPTFVAANYLEQKQGPWSTVDYTSGYEAEAKSYAETLAKAAGFVSEMVKPGNLTIAQLPDSSAAPFATEGLLVAPLLPNIGSAAEALLVYASARTSIRSQQLWIKEGFAHFAQVRWIEQQKGRPAAIDYLNTHLPALLRMEKEAGPASTEATSASTERSLARSIDDLYLQTKGMYVFWMLKDMIGDGPLNSWVQSAFQAANDKDHDSLESLLQSPDQDLKWFFDDWVNHDHGLPDFKVASVYSSKGATGYLVTITIENLGGAGAEVPVTLRTPVGPMAKRLLVRRKSKASVRIETTSAPLEITVNDGSVPESDTSNNSYSFSDSENK